MKTQIIIPARLESTRLPRKMLLNDTGKPLIQHTWEAACQSKLADGVCVATDSEEIAEVVRGFGGVVVMTGEHPTGLDRVADAATYITSGHTDKIINWQGDEPEITGEQVDALIRCMSLFHGMVTMSGPRLNGFDDSSDVKVTTDYKDRALWFSRTDADGSAQAVHIGVYAYWMGSLLKIALEPRSRWEIDSSLEQMRPLKMGMHIHVEPFLGAFPSGIDTAADYAAFVKRYKGANENGRN